MPTLTTVIPVYNGARFIPATLRSVAAQTRRPDRVIVLDNVSTDGTREAALSVPELVPEWRVNERNLGMFGNMNRALDLAGDTDLLHLLHADDLIHPSFYARMEQALAGPSSRSLAYCVSEFVDEHGNPGCLGRRVHTAFEDAQDVTRFLKLRAELRPIVCPSVVLRTARQPALVRFREDMPQLADLVFWAEWVAAAGHVVNIPDVLARYRVHPGSATRVNAARLQSYVLDEWKAMEIVSALLPRRGLAAAVRREKLRLIFAARSVDKVRMARDEPRFAGEIRAAAVRICGRRWWYPAKFLVGLRVALHYLRRP